MGLLTIIGSLALNASPFHAALRGAQTAAKSAGTNIGSALRNEVARFVSVAAIAQGVKKLVEFGSKINDVSSKLGVGTKDLQNLGYAAKQTGTDIDAVSKALGFLKRARLEALQDPKSDQAQAFKALGFSEGDVRNMPVVEQFRKIADTVRSIDFGDSEQPLIEKLLGKGSSELIPMFHEGLGQLIEQANELGIALSEDVISQLDELGDSTDRFIAQLRGPMAQALAYVLDTISTMFKGLNILFGGTGAAIGAMHEKLKSMSMAERVRMMQPGTKEFGEMLKVGGGAFEEHMNEVVQKEQVAEEAAKERRDRQREQIERRERRDFQWAPKEEQRKNGLSGLGPVTDSLTSVGNFLGGDPNRMVVIELGSIKSELRQIKENTKPKPGNGLAFPP